MVDPSMKFLGLKITKTGGFLPWREKFTPGLRTMKARLTSAGLGHIPAALSRAI